MKLGEIDTVKETFTADVFIQARWREPSLDDRNNSHNEVTLRFTCVLLFSFADTVSTMF